MGRVVEDIYPFRSPGGLLQSVYAGSTTASTTSMPAPTALITTVSGTVAITTITLPWTGFTGSIKYIPTGAFTGATGGTASGLAKPVGLAFTAVTGKVLELTFDGTLWYPSYVS